MEHQHTGLVTPSLEALKPGDSLYSGTVVLSREDVQAYLDGVGDTLTVYDAQDLVPPLCVVARVVRELLERLPLSPGILHAAQEFEASTSCSPGTPLAFTSSVKQNGVRTGIRLLGIAFDVRDEHGTMVLQGSSTVAVPAEPEPSP